jgi:uncharacterized iron-regulated membrane protein
MSPREKTLILFASAGFLVLNLLGFNFYQNKKLSAAAGLTDARQKLANAEMIRESREQVAGEMAWLAEREPEPAANQDVQTKLQQFCEREAKSAGLTIKNQKPMPSETTGVHFHRAKMQISVTGTEEALYRWLDRINIPDQFRIATQIKLTPEKEDDTKIDCIAVIEQWFKPLPPEA